VGLTDVTGLTGLTDVTDVTDVTDGGLTPLIHLTVVTGRGSRQHRRKGVRAERAIGDHGGSPPRAQSPHRRGIGAPLPALEVIGAHRHAP